jgi:hypothetical protein
MRFLIALLCFLATPALAQTGSAKTPTALNTETNTLWPDNTTGSITPFDARQTLLDIIASYANFSTGGTFNVFTPALGTSQPTGIYVTPTVGTSANTNFLTPFNVFWGSVTPVPSGTLGSLDGYECNQSTNQANSDTSAAGGNHCFGATIQLHGGTQAQGIAITSTIDTVATAGYIGADLNINKNIVGGNTVGVYVNSNGSQPVDYAYEAVGTFSTLFSSTNFTVDGIGNVKLGSNGTATDPVIQMFGKTSNSASITVHDNAANALLTLPNASGTLVSTAAAPLAIDGTTGQMSIATAGAWTAFTPSLSCGTATFTVNSARSNTLGKTTWAQLDFTVSAIGTCTNPITFTAPNTANSSGALVGQEIANSDVTVDCIFVAASATVTCRRNANTNFANNDHVVVSGVYENQ